jgi:hypothetical protein
MLYQEKSGNPAGLGGKCFPGYFPISRFSHFFAFLPGLPDFSLYNMPKRGKIYQNGGKYTKWT